MTPTPQPPPVGSPAVRMTGRIARLLPEKGFGFIRGDTDGLDYFFHQGELQGDRPWSSLRAEEEVEFLATYPPKGPRAADVKILETPFRERPVRAGRSRDLRDAEDA